jgi:multiple antibiotic resistance protein
MSEFIRLLVGMFAVVAPPGAVVALCRTHALDDHASQVTRLRAAVASFGVLAAFALLSGPILDWLDVSAESFQFAAGAAMFPLALRLVLAGDSAELPGRLPSYGWLVPLAVPLLAGPSAIIAAISYSARFGEGQAILATAGVLMVTAALLAAMEWFERFPPIILHTAGRLSGGLLIVIAVELAVDGVRSV